MHGVGWGTQIEQPAPPPSTPEKNSHKKPGLVRIKNQLKKY